MFEDLIDGTLSDAAIATQFADIVEKIKAEIKAADEAIVQHPVEVTTIVLGQLAVELDFAVSEDILGFVYNLLMMHSPIGSGADKHPGLFASSIYIYADGALVEDPSHPPHAKEYIFVSQLPYAVKIESGESAQAPHGVFEVTANESQRRFPSSQIDFIDHADPLGQYPAIRVII